MRTPCLGIALYLAAAVGVASPAAAQYGARPTSTRATGENYHVEASLFFWDPTPDIVINSESLGIPGDNVDFVNDLGITKSTFRQFRITLRPGVRHKFRFEYTPVRYDAQQTVTREFVFNGQRYTIGLPVTTNVHWNAYRFAYEFDFVSRDRGFAGLVLETKYTDINSTLSTTFLGLSDTEFTHAKAPIPALGLIGRGYVAQNVSITGEFTAFKLPDTGSGSKKYRRKVFRPGHLRHVQRQRLLRPHRRLPLVRRRLPDQDRLGDAEVEGTLLRCNREVLRGFTGFNGFRFGFGFRPTAGNCLLRLATGNWRLGTGNW